MTGAGTSTSAMAFLEDSAGRLAAFKGDLYFCILLLILIDASLSCFLLYNFISNHFICCSQCYHLKLDILNEIPISYKR